MKKITALFFCAAFSAPAFSAELICAPDFEVVGMNADFGKSSIRVLQGKMETQMGLRQLAMPSAADSVAVTDSDNHQINWARSRSCSYLLQTTLTRLGETVQVNARLMSLGSSSYVFKRAYKANSPDDLHPIFNQLGNALQDPKFEATETIYDVTSSDAKSLAKKKSTTYYRGSVGYSYFQNVESLYNFGFGYSWDARTIIGEGLLNILYGAGNNENFGMEAGIRVIYPFSSKNNSFYIGGGLGLAVVEECEYDYYDDWCNSRSSSGLLAEASAGYLIGRTSTVLFRLEASGNALLYDKKSAGFGARMILGIN
jgi:hypothetical protein